MTVQSQGRNLLFKHAPYFCSYEKKKAQRSKSMHFCGVFCSKRVIVETIFFMSLDISADYLLSCNGDWNLNRLVEVTDKLDKQQQHLNIRYVRVLIHNGAVDFLSVVRYATHKHTQQE